ncbi:hypothetical protein BaRGS_00012653 [Batillaria attramentaria]|uniref:Uncharacterized protein n=1 Tax=Batillaria attramentaria TaxID=370345 RepID=A0ABD0L980_9CAEN
MLMTNSHPVNAAIDYMQVFAGELKVTLKHFQSRHDISGLWTQISKPVSRLFHPPYAERRPVNLNSITGVTDTSPLSQFDFLIKTLIQYVCHAGRSTAVFGT